MSSIFESFRSKQALPVSLPEEGRPVGIRRRLSSLSLDFKIQSNLASHGGSWAFRRSKSVSSMGEYAGNSIRKWWDWGWTWILSRKPTFAKDLEMNEEETSVLGCHNKGNLRHVFYKVRSEFRKLIGSNNVSLPQTCRYDSYNYAKNFDDGSRSAAILSH